MKTRFLFNSKFKVLGTVLLLIGLIFFAYSVVCQSTVFVWHDFRHAVRPEDRDEVLDNEIQLILVLFGLFMIAFSKEPVEDELISQVRLDSLQWAVYCNYAIFFLLILLVYGLPFYEYALYNIFTLLLVFIIRFRWKIFQTSRQLSNESSSQL